MLYKIKVKQSREGHALLEAADYNEAVESFNWLEPEDIDWDDDDPALVVSAMEEEVPDKLFDVYMTKTTKLVGTYMHVKAESKEEALAKAEALYLSSLTDEEANPNKPCFVWDPPMEEVSFSARELSVK